MNGSMPWGLVDARPIVARAGLGDAGMAAIAGEQLGLVTTSQLRLAGFGSSAVHHRLRKSRLHAIHRGVFAVGHSDIGELGRCAAAVLGVGHGAVLSHRPAAAATGLLPFSAGSIDVSLATSGGHRRCRAGITVHHVASLERRDVRMHSKVPITTSARTILDIAETDRDQLEAALNEARAIRVVTEHELHEAARRHRGRVGAARLAALLAAEAEPGFSRSEAERILAGLIARAALPAPRRNRVVHGIELDFHWPDQRLDVEVDGFATHGRRRNFESDRDRDAYLASRGIQVIRLTWWQLTREAPKVVARLAAALALRGVGS